MTEQLIKELRFLYDNSNEKDDSIKYKKDEILNCIHDIQYEFILLDNPEKDFIVKVFYKDDKKFIEMMNKANDYYNTDEKNKIDLIKERINNFFLKKVPFIDNNNNMQLIDKTAFLENKEYEKYYFILNDLINNICDSGNINKLNDLYEGSQEKEDRDTIDKIHKRTDIEKYIKNIHNYFNNIRIINNEDTINRKHDNDMVIQYNIIDNMIPLKKEGGTNKQLARRKLVSRKLLSRRKLVSRKLVSRKLVSRRKRLPLNKEKKIKITRKKKINKN